MGQFKLNISLPRLSKLKLKNSQDSMTFGGGIAKRLNLTLSSDVLAIQTAQQLWGMLATGAWIFKELKLRLENHSLFMASPKLLLFCRTNLCLYSPLGSTADAWGDFHGKGTCTGRTFPRPSWDHGWAARWRSALLAASPMAAFVPSEQSQGSHVGITVTPTATSSWAGSDRSHQLKMLSPHRPALSLLPTHST